MRRALVLLAAAAAATAAAPVAARADGVRHFGVELTAGAPEGAGVDLVVRPVRALRLHGGTGYNGVSSGLHAGATLVPLASWFSPTLTVDYGEFPDGDASHLVQLVDPGASSPVLQRIGYRFANARAGIALGRKRATFYLDAGVSRITGRLHDAAAELAGGDPSVMVETTDPRVTAWTASARIGLILYFGR